MKTGKEIAKEIKSIQDENKNILDSIRKVIETSEYSRGLAEEFHDNISRILALEWVLS